MAWIQVDDTLREHRKTYALADALGIEDYAAVGLTVCLWTWALQNAEGGDLSGFPPRAIARACGWTGSAADLLAALKAAGFIDPDGCIHDWVQYTGRLMDKRAKNRERMRTARTTAEDACDCTPTTPDCDVRDTPAPCAAHVHDLCSARAAHREDTCTECAGATVQYQNSTVPEIDDGGDARACAREEACDADEADAGLPAIADAHNAVFDAAQRAGFAQTAHDLDKATALMADYSPEWVLEAVNVAADGTKEQRSWRYVEGILKRWKLRGGIDKEPRPETARPVTRSGTPRLVTAQQYTQRQYTAEELDKLFDDLTAEEL